MTLSLPVTSPGTVVPATEDPSPAPHYPAVDGIRGVAIASIVLFHAGLYENGILGVDAFFVLSGFFVTLTLLRSSVRGSIGLRSFYGRRIRRLLPAQLLVIAAAALAMWTWGTGAERGRFVGQGLSALLDVANWWSILQNEAYWNLGGTPGPLSAMWSLSLTEQFYLVWPPLMALLFLVLRRGTRRFLLTTLVLGCALFVASALWAAWQFTVAGPDRAYQGTDTHGFSLAAGAVAGVVVVLAEERRRRATAVPRQPTRTARLMRGLATLAVLGAVVAISVAAESYRVSWLYFGGFAGAAILIAIATVLLTRPSFIASVLHWAPLRALGRMSYIVFLVHMPLIWLGRTLWTDSPILDRLIFIFAATLVLSAVIHGVIAEPLRRLRWGVRGAIAAIVALALCGSGVVAVADVPAAGNGPHVLTLGDSLANDFATALTASSDGFAVTDGGLGGCGIMEPEATRTIAKLSLAVPTGCLPWQNRYRQLIARSRPEIIVIDLAWDATEQRIDDRWTDITQPEVQERYRKELDQLATLIRGMTQAKVLIAESRPGTPVVTKAQATAHSSLVREFAAQHAGIEVLPLDALVCPKGVCSSTTPEGAPRYLDGVHFSKAGLKELEPWLSGRVRASLSNSVSPAGPS